MKRMLVRFWRWYTGADLEPGPGWPFAYRRAILRDVEGESNG